MTGGKPRSRRPGGGERPEPPFTPYVPRQKLVGPITGDEYEGARFLGIREGTPNDNEQLWLKAILRIQEEEAEFLPLTPQAYKYRLASLGDRWDKTVAAGVKDFLVIARKTRWPGGDLWIDPATVDDSRTRQDRPPEWVSPTEFDQGIRAAVEKYERWRRLGQLWVPEAWVEAVGSMKLVTDTSHRYGAAVLSSGGLNSDNALFDLAERARRRFMKNEQRTVVLLIGDSDHNGRIRINRVASEGWALFRDLYARNALSKEEREEVARYVLRFEWVAVTPRQIRDWDLMPSDEAGTKFEVEAIPSARLQAELDSWLDRYTNSRMLRRVIHASELEREAMLRLHPEVPPAERWLP